ncbi:FAD/NAD(P)-binding domain-containing protein [Auriculariales sp. MPI-PUGE-AT-0066]|nr:FAD/NAD(P)-binding domain-containing protein [Auriculariales sp. MPI-PUGE-AT-0066]
MVKNVVVLGAAYAGARSAKLLARSLPDSHRVVVIDKNSHFNHLYLFPRYGVLPGHAVKAFVPDGNMFTSFAFGWPTPPSVLAGHEHTDPAHAPVAIHAKAVGITEHWIELDAPVAFGTGGNTTIKVVPTNGAPQEVHEVEGLTMAREFPNDEAATRRIKWDYIIFGTGCEMPRALTMDAREKKTGAEYLENQCRVISRAHKILVAGGGALGVQYATDIADLYNNPDNEALRPPGSHVPKDITIVSSRQFLPLYKRELHEAVLRRMEALHVNVVLNDRVEMPSDDMLHKLENNANERNTTTVRTTKGKEFEVDLVLGCTGQRPNSTLLSEWAPESLTEAGYVKVDDALRVPGLPKGAQGRIFAIGDVADVPGIAKAGHVAWDMGTVAAENVCALIHRAMTSNETVVANGIAGHKTNGAQNGHANNVESHGKGQLKDDEERDLVRFDKHAPAIKVTLGFQHSATENKKDKADADTRVYESEDGVTEGHWEIIWQARGADNSDPTK